VRPPRAPWGFTLVEVLIALVLLAMLMLVLTSALRSMGQVEERVEQRIEATEDYRLSTALLQEVLGRVSARRYFHVGAGTPTQAPLFLAGPGELSWVGIMPARYSLGGRHYLHLGLERGEGGARLVLRYAPWTGAASFDGWAQAPGRVLAWPVTAFSLRYQDPSNGQWSPVWPPPGVAVADLPPTLLPSAVELQIQGPQPAWPPLVIGLVATRTSDPSAVGGTFGGTLR